MGFRSSVLLLFSVLLLLTSRGFSSPSATNGSYSEPTSCSVTNPALAYFVEQTSWYNDLVLAPFLSQRSRSQVPHIVQTWLRNYIAGNILYFSTGAIWCWYIYYMKKHVYFPEGGIPSKEPIALQIWVTMKSMPLYVSLPTVSEYMIEKGWTKCYPSIREVGVISYTVWTIIYLILVEFGIYWMHRGLHDIKPLYKWLHATHHIYNKENTLSPFAGLAFNPVDGILQASPHVICILFMPTHFLTHIVLLFAEAVWTANIHDCIHGKVWPIMGAGYHTIHHTTYRHNYGHYTILMDWLFGTLRDPSLGAKAQKLS